VYKPEHIRPARLVSIACVCGLGCALQNVVAAEPKCLTTAELLVQLARDHALSQGGRQTAADVLHVKTLLRAAGRLDPGLADAYIWLYELAALGGDQAEAAEALERLRQVDPAHVGVFALWLDSVWRQAQTIEQRAARLESLLDEKLLDEQRSMVYARLARLALERVDLAQARAYLEQAGRLQPANPDVALLGLEMVEPDAPPHVRLQAALHALAVNPAQVELSWQIGLLLDECGFAEQAATFYVHALAVHRATASRQPIPAQKLLQLSRNLLARGQVEAAVGRAYEALHADPQQAESAIFLHWLFKHQSRQADAEELRRLLGVRFGRISDANESPVAEVAQAAWFYCFLDPKPERALALAEAAAERAPGDVFATRVLGWALALNQRTEDARRTLKPIAGRDPYAAYQLAKLLREAGEDQAAEGLLRNLTFVPRAGPAFELLSELGLPSAATQPAARRLPEVADALASFDDGLLEFARDSTRFLSADVRLENLSPTPGDPWWAVFTLTNRAGFPITLGPDWMVNPVFLLSFTTEGDRRRDYPHLMTVSLEQTRVLMPGQSISLRRTLDVGPLRSMSRRTPQQLQRITLRAIIDPEQDEGGQWRLSSSGQQLGPVYFNRTPLRTGPETFHALFRALSGESAGARFRAVELLAELLGEKQRAGLRPPAYRPESIPAQRIYQTLLSGLGSESWELRVRTLDALQMAGLDAQMVRAAEACLEHPHWLVRLMAVRLLARQGPGFADTARRIAADDQHELVRDLATSYLQRWAVSQPASQPSEPPGVPRPRPGG
jgi:tetratricopeptide (TPR) repeat protein